MPPIIRAFREKTCTDFIRPLFHIVQGQGGRIVNFAATYEAIFQFSREEQACEVHKLYIDSIRSYVQDIVVPKLLDIHEDDQNALLIMWSQQGAHFRTMVRCMTNMFQYLDVHYRERKRLPPLITQAYQILYEHLYVPHAKKVCYSILHLIEKDRAGEMINTETVAEAVRVFVDVGYSLLDTAAEKLGVKTMERANRMVDEKNEGKDEGIDKRTDKGKPTLSTLEEKLSLYREGLEIHILQQARTYYEKQAVLWLETDSMTEYLVKVDRSIKLEMARITSYLNESSRVKLFSACYDELITKYAKLILEKNTGLAHVIEDRYDLSKMSSSVSSSVSHNVNDRENSYSDILSLIYKLYVCNDQNIQILSEIYKKVVKDFGKRIMQKIRMGENKLNENKPSEKPNGNKEAENMSLIRELVELYHFFNTILDSCFSKDIRLLQALKAGFQDFTGEDQYVPRQLAIYAHELLRKNSKVRVSDPVLYLNNIVFLYGCLLDKDVFEQEYQTLLGMRLLKGESYSEHHEIQMITRMKTECGYHWTNKLQGMSNDIKMSEELNTQFKSHFDTERQAGFTFSIKVLTPGMWPVPAQTPGILPPQIADVCSRFKNFYLHKNANRKLQYNLDMGEAEVDVTFSKDVYRTLACSTYQMMILMVIGKTEQPVTYQHILDATGIPASTIEDHLLSLAHPRVQVLLKRPNNPELQPGHMFKLNPEFKSVSRKVDIPLFRSNAVNAEKRAEDEKTLEQQRRCQIEAAIVRIMKTRKTIQHNALITEVIQQLRDRFKVEPITIMRRIESLIEHEYMRRNEQDRTLYEYLA